MTQAQTSYKDNVVSLKGHRLQLFDIGYAFDPLLQLISTHAEKVRYQARSSALKALAFLDQRAANEKTDVLFLSPELTAFPLVLAYFHKAPSKVAFFLGQSLAEVQDNELVRDLAKKVVHFTSQSRDEVLEKFFLSKNERFAIIHSAYPDEVKRLITEVKAANIRHMIILDYSLRKHESLYFFCKKHGLSIIENADGSGEIIRY